MAYGISSVICLTRDVGHKTDHTFAVHKELNIDNRYPSRHESLCSGEEDSGKSDRLEILSFPLALILEFRRLS